MTVVAQPTPSVVEICSQLIAIDTSNYGRAGSNGERAAADYIMALLERAGYEPQLIESADTRANVVLRVPGQDRSLPGLLVHGHIDVVPAEAEQWSVPPFSGLIADGYVWGRGATDMKDMVAMTLAALLRWRDEGVGPRRDVVFAFVADEEEDGAFGAAWLVENHPELFAGVEAAISESGGIPVEAVATDGTIRRFYPVGVAERGTMHLEVTAHGTAGHGSSRNFDNPVVHLVRALARVSEHQWPVQLTPPVKAFLDATTAALGFTADFSSYDATEATLAQLGELRTYVESSLRCSSNLTVLRAGYKVNVVPGIAEAEVDVRTLPGTEAEALALIDELLGDKVTRAFISDNPSVSAPIDSVWFAAIASCIQHNDPDGIVVPFCLGGGTDAKSFAKLGIAGYGFSPWGQDPEGRVGSGMHGVDERVPIAAIESGQHVLYRYLSTV